MNKSCFGYRINGAVFCRPCGHDRLDEPRVTKVEELHAVSRELKCSRCGTSLGESDQ